MASPRMLRLLSITVSLGALVFILALLLRTRGEEAETVGLVDIHESLEEILRARELSIVADVGRSADGLDWRPLQRAEVSLQDALRLVASLAKMAYSPEPRKIFHPRAIFLNKPGWSGVIRFQEHPLRSWPVSYSQAGFRNPYEPADPPPRMRVIVTGDSHVEGVVPYEETIAALLEAGLRPRTGGSVEVLNGASGGYDFYNYVGFLEACLELRPNVFVLIVYGGNDFAGMIPLHAYHERTRLDLQDHAWRQRTKEFAERRIALMSQSFHQILHFKNRPEHAEFALDGAVRALRDMDALARRERVALVSAYLPPQSDVRPQDMSAGLAEVIEAFDLSADDLRITDRLADRFLAELAAVGIPVHDLRPALREGSSRLYWERDHHLNTKGQRVVARELLPLLLAHVPTAR